MRVISSGCWIRLSSLLFYSNVQYYRHATCTLQDKSDMMGQVDSSNPTHLDSRQDVLQILHRIHPVLPVFGSPRLRQHTFPI
jgi:hypothetical protein